jgi:centrin-3
MPGAMKTQDSPLPHVSQLQISQAAFMRVAGERILTRDPQVEIERAFQMFDQDRKGYIVLEDLRRVSRDLGESGLEEDELQAMINEFDYDGTGTVAREAFYTICLQ